VSERVGAAGRCVYAGRRGVYERDLRGVGAVSVPGDGDVLHPDGCGGGVGREGGVADSTLDLDLAEAIGVIDSEAAGVILALAARVKHMIRRLPR
jgi:hypothetical protein